MNIQRPLSSSERRLLQKMLSCNFPGNTVLYSQLDNLRVTQLDSSGCLALEPTILNRAKVSARVPVEATCADVDGVLIHVELHVVEGLLYGLEFYKEDGTEVKVVPPAESIELFS